MASGKENNKEVISERCAGMQKKVLGKGLDALIPTGDEKDNVKSPEETTGAKNEDESSVEPQKPENKDVPEKDEPEKVMFFNAKTGRYEEKPPTIRAKYDTVEMPIVSRRKEPRQITLPSAPPPPQLPKSSPAKTSQPKSGSYSKYGQDAKTEEERIKTLVRSEIDLHMDSLNRIIQGELDRLRYTLKKFTGSDESPAVKQVIDEVGTRIAKLKAEIDASVITMRKEVEADIDKVRKALPGGDDFENRLSQAAGRMKSDVKQEIIKETAEVKKVMLDLSRRFAAFERQIQEKEKEIEEMKNEIKSLK